jgi:hypothetical protein
MSRTYLIDKREVWRVLVLVEAEDLDEAFRKVAQGEGRSGDPEYSRNLPDGTWTGDDLSEVENGEEQNEDK